MPGKPLPSSAVSDATAIATLPYVSSSLKVGFGGPAVTAKTIRGPDQGALERQPHGPVHTAIGGSTGLMSQVTVSAQDPIFWMHHCNIDRLIEYWYAKSAGREYPTANTAWMDEVFTFTDLLGRQVTGKVRDVLYTPDLGYQYPLITPRQPPAPSAARVAAVAEEVAVKRGTARGRTLRARVEELVVPLTAAAGAGPNLTLQLADVVFLPAGRGVYFEVYANLPAGVAPDPEGPQFVGILGAFGNVAEDNPMGDHGHDMGGPATHTFDLSAAVDPATLDAVTISLVPVSTDPLPQSRRGQDRRCHDLPALSASRGTATQRVGGLGAPAGRARLRRSMERAGSASLELAGGWVPAPVPIRTVAVC